MEVKVRLVADAEGSFPNIVYLSIRCSCPVWAQLSTQRGQRLRVGTRMWNLTGSAYPREEKV